jgi:hypothetical protein
VALNAFCDCTTCDIEFTFGALDTDQNCVGNPLLSQVAGLLIIPDGATPPVDWTSKTDWEAAINNAATDNTAGRYIALVGGVDVPDKTITRVAKGVDVLSSRTYTLSAEQFNLSDTNRDFLRKLQCNPTNYKFWFETVDGHIFGGATGISPSFTDVDLPLGAGDTDLEKAVIAIQWRSKCDPDRTYIDNVSENFSAAAAFAPLWGFGTTAEIWGTPNSGEVWGF